MPLAQELREVEESALDTKWGQVVVRNYLSVCRRHTTSMHLQSYFANTLKYLFESDKIMKYGIGLLYFLVVELRT